MANLAEILEAHDRCRKAELRIITLKEDMKAAKEELAEAQEHRDMLLAEAKLGQQSLPFPGPGDA